MTGHTCPDCGDEFTGEGAVRDHAWDAHGACHHCGDPFDDRDALHTHWLAVHGSELSRADRKRAESTVGPLSFGDRLSHQGPAGAISGASVSRRTLVGGSAAAGVALIGGVLASGTFGGGDGSGASLDSHPAAAALDEQPTLGPAPGTADGTIIAFEDPSCPSCARFERDVYPKLKSNLVDAGDVSFVFRAIPVIRPWGEPASLALEAVQARDEASFWPLKAFYYRNQGGIDSDNVYRVTRSYLAERTDLDADAVVQDARQGTYRGDVDANLRASERAGVSGTPTFFLFAEGSFTTTFIGPQSYSVFANSLGV